MQSILIKRLAIGWLIFAIPVGCVAAFQLYCMSAGIYDPVAQDQMPQESLPAHRVRLTQIMLMAVVSSMLAACYARHAVNHSKT